MDRSCKRGIWEGVLRKEDTQIGWFLGYKSGVRVLFPPAVSPLGFRVGFDEALGNFLG